MNATMAICTCGRTLAVRKEAAAHLWVRVALTKLLLLTASSLITIKSGK